MHAPFFLVARLQLISESFPLQCQFLFRFRPDDCRLLAIQAAIPHESKVYGNTIAIHLLIRITEFLDFIIQCQSLRIYPFASTVHIDQQIHILFTGSHIQGCRSRFVKLGSILIEPVDSRIRESCIQTREQCKILLCRTYSSLRIRYRNFNAISARRQCKQFGRNKRTLSFRLAFQLQSGFLARFIQCKHTVSDLCLYRSSIQVQCHKLHLFLFLTHDHTRQSAYLQAQRLLTHRK